MQSFSCISIQVQENYSPKEITMKKKTIALVAHDSQKLIMAEWASKHKETLIKYNLVGTQGTARNVTNITGLDVKPLGHGPDGGDIVIASHILEGNIDLIIFLIDAKTPHGHEHDIQTLIRICVLRDIPLALNVNTANYLLK
jgi:methylglyoxal synthase